MTREEAIELKAAVGRLMYSDNKDIRDYNALIDFIDTALRPVSREQVEKVFPGCRSCKSCRSCVFSIHAIKDMPCKKCDPNAEGVLTEYKPSKFCQACGKPLTDEAVQMVMEKINNMEEMTNEH